MRCGVNVSQHRLIVMKRRSRNEIQFVLLWVIVVFANHFWLSAAFTPQVNLNDAKNSAIDGRSNLMVATTLQLHPSVDFGDPNGNEIRKKRSKKKYRRKRSIPETEKELRQVKKQWKEEYDRILSTARNEGEKCPNFWSFESLFPEPIWDEASIKQDLFGTKERDAEIVTLRQLQGEGPQDIRPQGKRPQFSPSIPYEIGNKRNGKLPWGETRLSSEFVDEQRNVNETQQYINYLRQNRQVTNTSDALASIYEVVGTPDIATDDAVKVDRKLSQLVEQRLNGYSRTSDGRFQYDTSLMEDGAVKFRDGVRLGKPLRVNADRLTYWARKELQHGRVEEAQELYEEAIRIDPEDGRSYLGLSRCAERRRDFTLARECLKMGIKHSIAHNTNCSLEDHGPNPFLLQALGCLEERMGHLADAEACYIAAAKSRPWNAASWVALAQLRTRKLGKGTEAGRVLYRAAERELLRAGEKPSSYVYTAWADLEYKMANDVRRAKELLLAALAVDPRCSVAFLKLGIMEANSANWDEGQKYFEEVLKFDKRNYRVLQAYALLEIKRPDGNSRKAIDLFEKALRLSPRDAATLQAYGLYVAKLGDVDTARDLLRRATEANKRHAPAWQAWGVLEMHQGDREQSRSIFQQGIWACAHFAGGQSGGYSCARLWQAWGLLEAQEGDHAAARRCFSRALDADNRNVATVTAWALMEEELGNVDDARWILERALKQFDAGSGAKRGLWTLYETMEQRLGNVMEAQRVYQRSMRETLERNDLNEKGASAPRPNSGNPSSVEDLTVSELPQVEIVRWDGGSSSFAGEVWMNDNAIESKIPSKALRAKTGNRDGNPR